ncbi:MAG: hypothetical protein JXQ76_09100, partial [Campylobacterales bacterium]|nr:hypothetical protein [Campylobacterales bacterium]
KSIIASMIAFAASTTMIQAGCEFHSESGEKLGLHDGECGVFSGTSGAACQGAKVKIIQGWDNKIVSVKFHHNSIAILEDYANGGHDQVTITKSGSVGAMSKRASLVICKQP